ncbi:MAG: hypothetical protein P4L35_09015 [Ignavibacteriaceae bacterium]|nr:hypothetical protein [Ignavibacteriaceae bacterium]
MKVNKDMSPSVPATFKINSNGDHKANKISEAGTDLYELQIDGKKYYSEYKDSFEIESYRFKGASIKDLPESVEIDFVNCELNYSGSIVTEEISTLSIQREKDEKCRVALHLNINPDNGHSGIMAILFQCLKRELILLHKEKNPKIEDDYEHYLKYSISVEGTTIEELIVKATDFNQSISKEIESAMDKTPSFLANHLGIDKSPDLFNSLENFHTI